MGCDIDYCLILTIVVLLGTFVWLVVSLVQGTASVDFWNYDARSWTTPLALMLFLWVVTCSLAHRMRFVLMDLQSALSNQKDEKKSIDKFLATEMNELDVEKQQLLETIAANKKAMTAHEEAMAAIKERVRAAEEDLEGLNAFVASIDNHVEESLLQTMVHDRRLRELREQHSSAEAKVATMLQGHRKIRTVVSELEEEDHQIKLWCTKQGSPEAALQALLLDKEAGISKLRQSLHACEGDIASFELAGRCEDEACRPPVATAPSMLPAIPENFKVSEKAQAPQEGPSPERQHPPPYADEHARLEQTHRELKEALQHKEKELQDMHELIRSTHEEHEAAAERLAQEAVRVEELQNSAKRSSERLKAFESMQEMISESQGLLESCRQDIEAERKEKARLKAQSEQERLRAQLLLDILRHFKEKLQGSSLSAFQRVSADLEDCHKAGFGNLSLQPHQV